MSSTIPGNYPAVTTVQKEIGESPTVGTVAATNFGQLVQKIVQSNSGQHPALGPQPRPPKGTSSWEDYKQQAEYYKYCKNFAYAEAMWLKAIYESHAFQRDDWRIIHSLEELATLYFALSRFEQAEVFAVRAFEAHKEQHGDDHEKTAASQEFLANVYFKLGRFEEAIKYAQDALAVLEKALGHNRARVATAYFNLGVIHHCCREFEKADTYYRRAYSIRTRLYGQEHLLTQKISNSHRDMCMDRQAHAEAKVLVDILIS